MITFENFSEEQKNAYNYVLDFVKSDRRQMVLSGYSGTGKTTLLNNLLDYFEASEQKLDIYCTAPTNEAVRVISKITDRPYLNMTIYSLMGLRLIQEDDKPPKLKPSSEAKIGEYDFVFIDEASMIQDELFDLIQYQLKMYSHLKIIYIGDDAQLPPVNNNRKKINYSLRKDENGEKIGHLDNDINKNESKVFKIEDMVKLTQVQRTAKDNPIIDVATTIRNNLTSPVDIFEHKTRMHENDGIIFYDDRDKYLNLMYDEFKTEDYKKDTNHVRVLAYTNKTVNILNSMIRKKLFGKEDLDEYVENENLIVDEPVMDPFKKGVIMFSVGVRLNVIRARLKTDHEHGIKFWTLTVRDYESREPKTTNIDVVHKDYIKQYRLELSKYAQEAKENAKKKPKWQAWAPYFKFKETYAWVKYSYCSTTHKAQGGTFKNVFVINSDCDKLHWDHIERNKLKYVAFTRASHLVHII